MGKLVDDAQAVADAAQSLVAEAVVAEAEQGGSTVSDKTVAKVTVTYSDGSSVDFSPAGDTAPGVVDTPAPVVSPVSGAGSSTGSDTPDPSSGAADAGLDTSGERTPEPVPEGGTEVEPTIAGVVPGQS